MSHIANDIFYEHQNEIKEGAFETCESSHNNGEESCLECRVEELNV